MTYTTLLLHRDGAVGIIRLNRPAALNALNLELTGELGRALAGYEADDSISAIVLTGSDTVFAAGADIKEIAGKTIAEAQAEQFITATWEDTARCRKPVIAAVAGLALGGGCELALMCDIIVADPTARFGLPETGVGIIPGAGGTQRLTRILGRPLAMDMILSGRTMPAEEALARGLISRLAPTGQQVAMAIEIGQTLARRSRPVLMLAKEAVNQSQETHLSAGIYIERRLLYSALGLEDCQEGLQAFTEKRRPTFHNR